MIHEKIILVNDQENANVVEKNHKHVKDNTKMINGNLAMANDNDDENLKNNHNDLNPHYLKKTEIIYKINVLDRIELLDFSLYEVFS
jgi:hypothetical protein